MANKKASEVEYFAGKQLTVTRDGVTLKIGVGTPVPEAADWRNLHGHLRGGSVIGVLDGLPIAMSRRQFHRLGPVSQEMKQAIDEARRQRATNSMAAAEAARAAGRVVVAGAGALGGNGDSNGSAAGDGAVAPAKTMTVKKKRTRKKA